MVAAGLHPTTTAIPSEPELPAEPQIMDAAGHLMPAVEHLSVDAGGGHLSAAEEMQQLRSTVNVFGNAKTLSHQRRGHGIKPPCLYILLFVRRLDVKLPKQCKPRWHSSLLICIDICWQKK